MREIVQISIGQCGIQLGTAFWACLCAEHAIDPPSGRKSRPEETGENAGILFSESAVGTWTPRSLLVDSEMAVLDGICSAASPWNGFFRPENVVGSSTGTGNCWALGYDWSDGKPGDSVLEALRREVERCEALQAVQICHALGGGTGSGFGSWVLESLRDTFPEALLLSAAVMPSAVSHAAVEPYNASLVLNTLRDEADAAFLVDNAALMGLIGSHQHQFEQVNHLLGLSLGGLSVTQRFRGDLNCSLRKLVASAVPFAALHFLTLSAAPVKMLRQQSQPHGNAAAGGGLSALTTTTDGGLLLDGSPSLDDGPHALDNGSPSLDNRPCSLDGEDELDALGEVMMGSSSPPSKAEPATLRDVTADLFKSLMLTTRPELRHQVLAASCVYRGGDTSAVAVAEAVGAFQQRECSAFAALAMPQCVLPAVCYKPVNEVPLSAFAAVNSSAVAVGLRLVAERAELLQQQRAYVHWYEAAEVPLQALQRAQESTLELAKEYESFETREIDVTEVHKRRRNAARKTAFAV